MTGSKLVTQLNKWLPQNFTLDRRFLFLILLSLGLFLALVVNLFGDLYRVNTLTIAAGSKQGESYVFSQEIARIVAKYQPHIKIEVQATEGSEENVKLLEENKVQLATVQADIPAGSSAQIVSYLFPDTFQLVVTEKSGIKEVSDLRGKHIGLPPEGSGQFKSFLFLAEHYRLKPNDFRYTAMDEPAADVAFRNNQVDAVFRVRPPGNQSVLQLVQNSRGQLIAIDQAAAMKIKESALEETVIPKGAYQGYPPIPAIALPTVAVQRTLLANKSVDNNLIRQITSILYERRQELATAIPLANYINPPNALSGTALPIHPGAAAYYNKDKPSFVQEYADYVGLLLTITLLFGGWIWELKSRLEKGQKNRADEKNQEIVQLINGLYSCNDLKGIKASREKLFRIFEEVVKELDKDQITPESFQSFKFTWEVAHTALDEREREILSMTKQSGPQKSTQLKP